MHRDNAGMRGEGILIGTSGWSYGHWKGPFYPAALPAGGFLPFYAGRFCTVEINSSFYRLPEERTLSRWRDSVPDSFVFAVKGSGFITHRKKLRDPQATLPPRTNSPATAPRSASTNWGAGIPPRRSRPTSSTSGSTGRRAPTGGSTTPGRSPGGQGSSAPGPRRGGGSTAISTTTRRDSRPATPFSSKRCCSGIDGPVASAVGRVG